MTIRFADILSTRKTSPITSNQQDFVVRNRRPIWQTLGILFVVILIVSIVLGSFITDPIILGEVLFILLGSLGTYVIIVLQRTRDLMLATEFQNALLSSALGQSNKFCMIIKNDSVITYIDPSFQEMFPNFYKEPHRAIGAFLEHGQVSKEESKTVFAAIEKRVRSKVVFDIIDSKKQTHRIIMSLEPIKRPKGFMLLRGREFIEKRVLDPETPDKINASIFNKTYLSVFSYIMDSMDIGAYIIDLFGNITYANLTLEQWLDFDENEIVDKGLSLKDIISRTENDIAVSELKNYDGKVILQRKINGNFIAIMNQKAIYNEQGTIIGYCALLHQIKEDSPVHRHKNINSSW